MKKPRSNASTLRSSRATLQGFLDSRTKVEADQAEAAGSSG